MQRTKGYMYLPAVGVLQLLNTSIWHTNVTQFYMYTATFVKRLATFWQREMAVPKIYVPSSRPQVLNSSSKY